MNWRTPITLLVLLVFLGGAGWYGWQQFSAPFDSGGDEAGCVTEKLARGSRLTARQVVVNVYNAGNREGLAGQTLNRLRQRDFRPGVATNAPSRIRVDEVAVYDSDPRSTEVSLVRQQFTGTVRVFRRPDISDGVDVVVGSDFRGIAREAPRSVRLPRSEEVCLPEQR